MKVSRTVRLPKHHQKANGMVVRYNAVSGKYYVADEATNKAVDKLRFFQKGQAVEHMNSL